MLTLDWVTRSLQCKYQTDYQPTDWQQYKLSKTDITVTVISERTLIHLLAGRQDFTTYAP